MAHRASPVPLHELAGDRMGCEAEDWLSRLQAAAVVLGGTQALFDEINATAALVDGAKHIPVMNHFNEASYMGLTDEMKLAGSAVIDVAKLNELAADHVDKAGVPFEAFVADESQSAVM
jgi:hypothetical protein